MLQRLSQVAKADCNSGTVDHPESRLGASKFVNEVFEFECAILIHSDHIQSTWCRGYSSFQKARPGKEDLPALIILDIICMFLPTVWQSNPHWCWHSRSLCCKKTGDAFLASERQVLCRSTLVIQAVLMVCCQRQRLCKKRWAKTNLEAVGPLTGRLMSRMSRIVHDSGCS